MVVEADFSPPSLCLAVCGLFSLATSGSGLRPFCVFLRVGARALALSFFAYNLPRRWIAQELNALLRWTQQPPRRGD
jgi:uncharacterized RDD family membrane protein YckC